MPYPNPLAPVSAPNGQFIVRGILTIRWGTDGFVQDAGLQTKIVASVKPKRDVDRITMENNSGFIAGTWLLIQGQTYEISAPDDSAAPWPVTGQKILLAGSLDPANIEFQVEEDSSTYERKQPGMITITARCYAAFPIV